MTREEKMTPEEAIAEISYLKVAVNKIMEQALDMAIQALSQEPCECDDAISREAAIKALSHGEGCRNICANAIRQLPSVTQKCEKCAMNGSGSKYCDNCGAKMESEDKE